jgi:hypothetical protein
MHWALLVRPHTVGALGNSIGTFCVDGMKTVDIIFKGRYVNNFVVFLIFGTELQALSSTG